MSKPRLPQPPRSPKPRRGTEGLTGRAPTDTRPRTEAQPPVPVPQPLGLSPATVPGAAPGRSHVSARDAHGAVEHLQAHGAGEARQRVGPLEAAGGGRAGRRGAAAAAPRHRHLAGGRRAATPLPPRGHAHLWAGPRRRGRCGWAVGGWGRGLLRGAWPNGIGAGRTVARGRGSVAMGTVCCWGGVCCQGRGLLPGAYPAACRHPPEVPSQREAGIPSPAIHFRGAPPPWAGPGCAWAAPATAGGGPASASGSRGASGRAAAERSGQGRARRGA